MESQVTLVDTSTFGFPQDIIYFSRDDMKNTYIQSSDGGMLYAVETNINANDRTVIYRANSRDIVALIKHGELCGDKILFRQAYSMKVKEWLHGANGRWNDFPVTFVWNLSRYTWKSNDARQIALYLESDPTIPIAWFQSSRQDAASNTLRRALLALGAGAHSIIDAIVVSLLIVEQGLRVKESRNRNF